MHGLYFDISNQRSGDILWTNDPPTQESIEHIQ